MNHQAPFFRSMTQLQQGFKTGTDTAVDVGSMYEDRVANFDNSGPSLRAVLTLDPDWQSQAESVKHLPSDSALPLQGIPVLIKDNIIVNGEMPTTGGSLALQHWKPREDAPLVKRLREAGAIIFGKTNLSEWANFRSTHSSSGWSSVGSQTRNPHVLNRDPSGSSSGSAVAVSAGFCAGAVGTETDGSITAPASQNGIVGVKPTVGLVSRTGIIPISHRQDTAGPMTRTVRDAALMLSAMAGPDPADPATEDIPANYSYRFEEHLGATNLAGVRIGALKLDWLLPQIDVVYATAIDILRDLRSDLVAGLRMTGIGWGDLERLALLTEFKMGIDSFFQSQTVTPPIRHLGELIEFNRKKATDVMPIFGQELFLQSQETDPNNPDYQSAVMELARLSRDEGLLKVMDENRIDMLVAPTANPSALIDHLLGSRGSSSFSSPAAVAGFPHVTVPMGTVCNLPVGLSFIGKPFSEHSLLQAADCFERSLGLALEPQFLPTLEIPNTYQQVP